MSELIFTILFGTPQLQDYTCTAQQLSVASEVFIPCEKERFFEYCYETAIKEYCEVKLWDK